MWSNFNCLKVLVKSLLAWKEECENNDEIVNGMEEVVPIYIISNILGIEPMCYLFMSDRICIQYIVF